MQPKPKQLQIEKAWQPLMAQLHTCANEEERANLIRVLSSITGPTVLSFLNAHACNLATESAEFHQALCASDFLLRDGAGIELHLKIRGLAPGVNLNGTDLIPELIDAATTKGSVALYGTLDVHLQAAKHAFNQKHVTVFAMNGYQPDEAYIAGACATRPKLIVLGMGMPKQEILSVKLKNAMAGSPVLIVNGGAIIDFMAGRYPRAPSWVQKIRCESLYRLSKEPRRLWRRNVGSIIFLSRSLKALIRTKLPANFDT